MTDDPFSARWHELVQAARQAPTTPMQPVDVARILAARRRRPEPLRIGWLPPSLAAAALIACTIGWAAGLELSPLAGDPATFLASLPQQVPRAPHLPAPDLPSASGLIAQFTPHLPQFSPVHSSLETSP